MDIYFRQRKIKERKRKNKKSVTKPKKRWRITDYRESIIYSEVEKYQTEKSARIGELREAIVEGKGKGRDDDLEGFIVSDEHTSNTSDEGAD